MSRKCSPSKQTRTLGFKARRYRVGHDPLRSMKTKKANIVFAIAAVLCVIAIPAIGFAGGLLCFPLFALPAIAPYGIWLFLVVSLTCSTLGARKNARQVRMPLGALAIAVASMWLLHANYRPTSVFVRGLEFRFAQKAGYDAMRQFAKEVAESPGGVAHAHDLGNPQERFDPKRRAEFGSRYPFLDWGFGTGILSVSKGVVSQTWGSALTGHWGFRVATGGSLGTPKDCVDILRASDDIQFVYYED